MKRRKERSVLAIAYRGRFWLEGNVRTFNIINSVVNVMVDAVLAELTLWELAKLKASGHEGKYNKF
jgi:hypothetical protein